MAPRCHLSYTWGVILAGIVGTLFQPWIILEQLFRFLGYSGAIMSAVAGVIICDYYILRKRRLHVKDLYRQDGQFTFHRGVNVAGMIAWLISSVLAIVFIDYMYFVGFPLSAIIYYVLMKQWYLKKFPQKEIESNYADDYLGTSANRDWEISV